MAQNRWADQPASLGSLPGPEDITRVELPNGVVVLARANFSSPSVVLQGYLPVGSLFDPDPKLGLANFTAAALMRGTERRSFQQIYDALESVGAGLSFGGGTHTSGFSGRALSEDLEMLLDLVAESLRRPAFPAEEVERLRAQFLTGLAIRAQDTAEMASLTFDGVVYEGHPYSRPDDGAPETVEAIEINDLVDFHHTHYGPRGMVVVLVGAVDPAEGVEKVARVLGDWQNPLQPESPALPPAPVVKEARPRKVTIAGKSQADLIVGAAGPERLSPDYLAASLGNSVLGQFGMFGRIGDVVREQAGLAYYAYSSLSGGYGPGPWYITAGVDPDNVGRALELIASEIARFTREPVLPEELEDSQANFIGRLPLSMESNAGVAGAILNLERYSLGLDYYRRYPGLVAAVTREAILQAAQKYLQAERLGTAVAGP
jgi:zinc protease